jgi:hypothetical protein
MRKLSGRLLITLVLLAVATSAAWTPAHARSRDGTRWVRSHATASVVIGSRPGMRPASGEPDSGAQKTPPTVTGRSGLAGDFDASVVGQPGGASNWFRGISMIWMARYLGVS